MPFVHLTLNILNRNTSDPADGIGKILLNYFSADSNCLKNLRALIGLYGRDSHLGGNLDDAVQNCAVIVVNGGIIILVQHAVLNQLMNTILRQIRIYRAGSVAKKGREMMHLPGLRAL